MRCENPMGCKIEMCHAQGCLHESASQPNPTPQELTAPTLEQLAKDAERYRKLCQYVEATNDAENGNELCFKVWIDWGDIQEGTSDAMLSAALDQL